MMTVIDYDLQRQQITSLVLLLASGLTTTCEIKGRQMRRNCIASTRGALVASDLRSEEGVEIPELASKT